MKTVGILGGTSWPSTIYYYQKLNELAFQKLGGFNSARILLYSINYHAIKSNYGVDFAKIEELLLEELQFFLSRKPDCLIIANNTLHKAFDAICGQLNLDIPVFHAGFLCVEESVKAGYKTVLLLGTKFTMEDGFFAKYFEDKKIKVVTPNLEERLTIQAVQAQIAAGVHNFSFKKEFEEIISRYATDAVCLACTELPLVLNQNNCPLNIINPSMLQIVKAMEFILS